VQVEAISEFAVLASLIAGVIIAAQPTCHKHRRAGGDFESQRVRSLQAMKPA